ncbi:MAG: polysaccharide biosynthesis tyrosine autokinase [Phycisphaerae bacterium]|jgi:capsular exopolysaccharide synthesis family protein|nr:polysaccharide biosynthesis tyrosine autokinase [Phycisphaerae bacterium]
MTDLQTRERLVNIVPGGDAPVRKPPAPQSAPDGGLTGRDILRIVRRRKWLIIVSVAVFFIMAFAGTWFWLKYAPRYTASAYVGILARNARVMDETVRMVGKTKLEIIKKSYVQMALREAVLKRALGQDVVGGGNSLDRIRQTDYFKVDKANIITRLQKDIKVASVRDTKLIVISMNGPNPRQLPNIVNAVAQALVTENHQGTSSDRVKRIRHFQETLDRLKTEQGILRKRIQDLIGASEVPMMRGRRNIQDVQLQTLGAELTGLELARAQSEAGLKAHLEQEQAGTLPASPTVLRALDLDPIVRSLRNSQENLQIELETLIERLGDGHRRAKTTRDRLANVRNSLAAKEKELIALQISAIRQQREAELAAITERLLAVRSKYNEAASEARDLAVRLGKIEEFTQERQRRESEINQLDSAVLRFTLTLQADAPMEIEGLAEIPKKPSWPKWTVTIPLGVFLGLVVGLGLAILLELIDTSIKSPSDVSRRINLPLLGMIPHEDDLDEEIEDMRTALLSRQDSLVGEAFRQVRTCLLFSGPPSERRSLMVTSPSPGDGRTVVATNLAACIAHGGRKVLLVDANFHQPTIDQLFPQAPQGGLSSALVGQADWTDLIHQVEENLYVLASGPLPPNPAELLGSEQMGTVISEMTAQYDQVLFDAAPMLVVTDPAVLSTLVDGVILVVRAGASTYGVVQRARDMLMRVGAHVIGAVLNGVRVTAGGYFRKSYDTFYEYRGEQAQLPEK